MLPLRAFDSSGSAIGFVHHGALLNTGPLKRALRLTPLPEGRCHWSGSRRVGVHRTRRSSWDHLSVVCSVSERCGWLKAESRSAAVNSFKIFTMFPLWIESGTAHRRSEMSGQDKKSGFSREWSPAVRASGFEHKGQLGEDPVFAGPGETRPNCRMMKNRYCLTVKQRHGQSG